MSHSTTTFLCEHSDTQAYIIVHVHMDIYVHNATRLSAIHTGHDCCVLFAQLSAVARAAPHGSICFTWLIAAKIREHVRMLCE